MNGKLEKLKILSFEKSDYTGKPKMPFLATFNPDSYTVERKICYSDKKGSNAANASEMSYNNSNSRTMSFKFLFDSTGVTGMTIPVPLQVEQFMEATANVHGEIHRPHYLILNWGTLLFKCVLTKASVNYTLFSPAGIPLRATIDATFKEHMASLRAALEARLKSPDLTREVIVKAGDTLPLLCYEVYGDASYYPDVARVNRIKNSRLLKEGQKILFPPIINIQND